MNRPAPSPLPSHPTPAFAPAARAAAGTLVESTGDMADVVQAVLRHTRFNLRQLQPAWLEGCVAQQMARLGSHHLAEHAARLERDREEAARLLHLALQPPGEGEGAPGGTLRASTRTLLDSAVRARPDEQPLDVWVLVPEGSAMVSHLRDHLATLGRAPGQLRLHGPQAVRAFHGAIPGSPLASPAGSTSGEGTLGDVRQALAWLEHALAAHVEDDPSQGADLIIAADLFSCWRPDLQRLWLGRLAGALRHGGLLMLGRPKALWRAPRGLRAMHVDGLHWLQRGRTAHGSAPATAPVPPAPAARAEAAMAPSVATAVAVPPLPQPGPGTAGGPVTAALRPPERPPEPAPPPPSAPVQGPAGDRCEGIETAEQGCAAASPIAATPTTSPSPETSAASATRTHPATVLADIGVMEIELAERRLTLNAAMHRLMGRSTLASPLGWSEWLETVQPDDHALLEQALQGSLALGSGWQLQIRVTPVDSPPHLLELRGEVCLDGRGERRLLCLATLVDCAGLPGQPGPARTAAPAAPPPPRPGPSAVEGRLCVVTSLPGAVARQELELVYQPQLDVQHGTLRAVEALLRWNHPQHGLVAPLAFIPWAEECGLIVELGRWVLQRACQQARRWQALGLPAVPVAVNISPVQLRQGDFVAVVESALAEAGLLPQALELELTESTLLHQPDTVRQQLAACRRLGVRVALDDFGTGQTNLSRLHRLPLDKIKLDPSFIGNLCIDRGAQAIVRSVVSLGHQLGLDVVAEGVEQAQQLALLGEARCDGYQGHHATPAVSAEELTRRLIDATRLSTDSAQLRRPGP